MQIYIIQGSDLEIYFLDESQANLKLKELNAPYEQWLIEEDKRRIRMQPFVKECEKNWKELKAEADSMKTGIIHKDSVITDKVRESFLNQGKPWYIEIHPNYERPAKFPNTYILYKKEIGVIYNINDSEEYEYED